MQAPTGSNRQGWRWIVVDDSDTKSALADIYRRGAMAYLTKARARAEERGDAQTARVLNAGPDDIRAMLIYEVGPACAHNLLVLAPLGLADWVPFDQGRLVRRIRRNWHRPLHRWLSRRRAGDALGVIEPSLRRLWQAMEERP